MQRPRLAGLDQALDARHGFQHQAVHLPDRGVEGLTVVLRRVLVGEDGKLGIGEAAIAEMLRVALGAPLDGVAVARSEEHTSELQSLMRISYAVFCLKKKKKTY